MHRNYYFISATVLVLVALAVGFALGGSPGVSHSVDEIIGLQPFLSQVIDNIGKIQSTSDEIDQLRNDVNFIAERQGIPLNYRITSAVATLFIDQGDAYLTTDVRTSLASQGCHLLKKNVGSKRSTSSRLFSLPQIDGGTRWSLDRDSAYQNNDGICNNVLKDANNRYYFNAYCWYDSSSDSEVKAYLQEGTADASGFLNNCAT